MCQGLGHIPVQMPGVISDQETNEQVPEAGRVFLVAEGRMDHVPERLGQVEFFNEVPAGWRCAQVDLVSILNVGPGVEQGAQDSKKFWLLSLDHHGQHLAIQVNSRVGSGHERLELLEPLFTVEESTALREMITQMVVLQSQFVKEDGGPISTETAAIQADIEQPVIGVIRFLGRSIQQESR